jgi:hypothetical protein
MTQLSFYALLDQTPLLDNIITPSHIEYPKVLSYFAKCDCFCIDIETAATTKGNGLDHFRGDIRLIQIYLPKEKLIIIIDLFKDQVKVVNDFIGVLGRQLKNDNTIVVGHNIYFDLLWLRVKYGFKANNLRDTLVMSQILWCGIKGYRHGLKDVYSRLFNKHMSKDSQNSDWDQPDLSNTQLNYAATDVINTFRCAVELGNRVKTYDDMPSVLGSECDYKLSEIVCIESNAIPGFVECAANGLPINLERCNEIIEQYQQAIDDLYADTQVVLNLPYSAQPHKLCIALWDKFGIWVEEELPAKDVKDEEVDKDFIVTKLNSKNLFGKDYPEIRRGYRLATTSSNLFKYYCETGEKHLLILTLTRSLKKCLDALLNLRSSSIQNYGFARTGYRVLGGAGTGRSTSSGGNKSTIIAQNLQNLPNPLSHPLLQKYNLIEPREAIQAREGEKLGIIDLSAAHSRYMARFSEDPVLINSLSMKDPHLLMTSRIMSTVKGKEYTVDDLIKRGGKDDPEINQYRKLAKTCYYLALNVGGANRLQQSFQKAFQEVPLEDCKLASKAFNDTFHRVVAFQRNLHKQAQKNIVLFPFTLKDGRSYKKKFAQFKTIDGRLIHLECFDNWKEKRDGTKVKITAPKINDCTSCMMISAEALAEKRTLTAIVGLLDSYNDNCKLINFVHDEIVISFPDNHTGERFLQEVYKINSKEFTDSLKNTPSGMSGEKESALKCKADKYSEK